jgi:hypothetical protein|tara:strand:- start:242 stop:400 length:159 start_codon:yes stop_codon:yes gene_type:complete
MHSLDFNILYVLKQEREIVEMNLKDSNASREKLEPIAAWLAERIQIVQDRAI